ncbi:hypothetical protein SSPO_068380 [Streptomyces antimycoticus]|uniref:Uncharacterized protein n=1 Tax=Streptomyces antimycoticus TaxID=68175 RepID=A0A499UU01_9ACTN|nr:hypothetical protein SSPO_068380 [Streptomyces antimycoticus]
MRSGNKQLPRPGRMARYDVRDAPIPGCEGRNTMEVEIMNTQSTAPVYTAPIVLDAGDVVEVTLGTNNFDTADDTQYKNA